VIANKRGRRLPALRAELAQLRKRVEAFEKRRAH
jgi:hypothetical protein